jgi:hypothetical protein
MLNSRKILNDVWRDVVKRAKEVAPLIDELATADRDAVAFAVREVKFWGHPRTASQSWTFNRFRVQGIYEKKLWLLRKPNFRIQRAILASTFINLKLARAPNTESQPLRSRPVNALAK